MTSEDDSESENKLIEDACNYVTDKTYQLEWIKTESELLEGKRKRWWLRMVKCITGKRKERFAI